MKFFSPSIFIIPCSIFCGSLLKALEPWNPCLRTPLSLLIGSKTNSCIPFHISTFLQPIINLHPSKSYPPVPQGNSGGLGGKNIVSFLPKDNYELNSFNPIPQQTSFFLDFHFKIEKLSFFY